jgi:UDP-2-acetamido-2-deoxy-ribo-hexuluronate aminotransferase
MDTLQCAIVLAKLQRFEWELGRRKEIAASYSRLLAENRASAQPLTVRTDRDCVWAQYTVMVDARDAMQAALHERGIPSAVHYPLSLNMQPAYRHLCCADCTPNSHAASKRVLSLPMSADLADHDLAHVIDAWAGARQ